ncbi:MAG: endopeptidase La [Aromatoleum sp.]|jgi:ATP-dependent Lon protease|uniref:endopeptidase La n=1 Tax=Aromatoleum sp. TaxID=2307007 RepID=UPI002893D133|nr:endopeptidase La [Aromatoleum sp.]MDT3671090.1 endopeptidase La [Aromatoleum sp.]
MASARKVDERFSLLSVSPTVRTASRQPAGGGAEKRAETGQEPAGQKDREAHFDASWLETDLPEDALILLPVRDLVLFPGLVTPIVVRRQFSVLGAQVAVRSERLVGVVLQRDEKCEAPSLSELEPVGTVAAVVRYLTTPDGAHHVVCEGRQRFRLLELLDGYPFYAARVERLTEPDVSSPAIEARVARLKALAGEILELLPQTLPELASVVETMASPSLLADFVAALMDLDLQEKQDILATLEVEPRLDKVVDALARRVEVVRLSEELNRQTRDRIDDQQRELLLREQLKTIQNELGEADDDVDGVKALEDAITRARMPEDVERHARKELRRLARMSEAAADYSMLRTYVEWLTELPWSVRTEERIDIAEARRILDEDHYGLDKVKRRILEYLAVRKLKPSGKSPILCFAGPPGVGKTSLGQSIACATGRKFARVSLGGVHSEAEIRGHRRTYVGALPGNVIHAIHKAGARNCVLMLDELDKLGSGIQGDPAAALLEVLDPEQNGSFTDNYLGVPFDLSEVMFLATVNLIDSVPAALRDRVEVIQLPGYTEDEKDRIASRFLVPRELAANGLTDAQCALGEGTVRALIHGYTREAGVRNLEREIGRVFRHAAMQVAEGSATRVDIGTGDLEGILGAAEYESEIAMRDNLPGVATGLAWTPTGGDILFIEASMTPGSGKLILTGQLGEVMKESAQAALTLVKAEAAKIPAGCANFDRSDVHVHVPAGSIPKDGPSAGVAMFVALVSLVRETPVRADRAMTGEISLRGLVLPVGGIREKVLAALQAGITTVMLPARNRRALEEIPEDARRKLRFVWLETVEDALSEALAPLVDEPRLVEDAP